jgi:hypothetical protein
MMNLVIGPMCFDTRLSSELGLFKAGTLKDR